MIYGVYHHSTLFTLRIKNFPWLLIQKMEQLEVNKKLKIYLIYHIIILYSYRNDALISYNTLTTPHPHSPVGASTHDVLPITGHLRSPNSSRMAGKCEFELKYMERSIDTTSKINSTPSRHLSAPISQDYTGVYEKYFKNPNSCPPNASQLVECFYLRFLLSACPQRG